MARLIERPWSEVQETVRLLVNHPDFDDELGLLIRKPGGADTALSALRDRFFPPKIEIPVMGGTPYRGGTPSNGNIILVPDLAAVDFTALVKRELRLTYLDPDYERWDFYRGLDGKKIPGRGKRFEPLLWTPGRQVSSEEVRSYFCERGMIGHVGAFTEWRRTCGLQGWHASIPDDNGCWRSPDGSLYAPYSDFDGGHRRLDQDRLADDWDDYFSFVGFRELP